MFTKARTEHKLTRARPVCYAIEYPRGRAPNRPAIVHRFASRAERDHFASIGHPEQPGGREAAGALNPRVRSAVDAAQRLALAWPVTV